MRRKKLEPELELNHRVTAMEFIYKAICVGCVLREGQCRSFAHGDLEECYKRCWWFNQAVHKIKKILDKYDK